jgi:hypothetical protein
VRDHFSRAREPDRRPLTIDESCRGCGLLAHLGYASLARLRACEAHDVCFIPRLQGNSQPKVDDIARGQVTGECFPGTDRDALWEDDTRGLDCRAIDADVHVGGDKHPLKVADLYRVRWAVELSIRLDPSMNCLDVIDAERPCSLKTLLHVSLIASTIAAILAHTHHLKTHPPQAGAPRTEAPLHPQLLAWPLAVSCQSMAQAFDLKGTAAKRP